MSNVGQRRKSRLVVQSVIDATEGTSSVLLNECEGSILNAHVTLDQLRSTDSVENGNFGVDTVTSETSYFDKCADERRRSLQRPSISLFNGKPETIERRRSEIFIEQESVVKEFGVDSANNLDHLEDMNVKNIEDGADSITTSVTEKDEKIDEAAVGIDNEKEVNTDKVHASSDNEMNSDFDIMQNSVPTFVDATPSFFYRNLSLAKLQETEDLYARNKDAYDLIAAQCLLYIVSALECIRTCKNYVRKPVLGVIGYGGVGKQIVQTALEFGWPEKGIVVVTRDVGKTRHLRETHNNNILCTSKYDALKNCSILIVSTLPVHLKEVLHQLNKHVDISRKFIVSTLVAMTREKLISLFGTPLIVRTFIDARNLPLLVPLSGTETAEEGDDTSSTTIPGTALKSKLDIYNFSSKHSYLINTAEVKEKREEEQRLRKLKWKLMNYREQLKDQQREMDRLYLSNQKELYSLYLPTAFHQLVTNYGMVDCWLDTLQLFAESQEEAGCIFRFKQVRKALFEASKEKFDDIEITLFSNKVEAYDKNIQEIESGDLNNVNDNRKSREDGQTYSNSSSYDHETDDATSMVTTTTDINTVTDVEQISKEPGKQENEKHVPMIIEKSPEFSLIFAHLQKDFLPFFRQAMFRHLKKQELFMDKVGLKKKE